MMRGPRDVAAPVALALVAACIPAPPEGVLAVPPEDASAETGPGSLDAGQADDAAKSEPGACARGCAPEFPCVEGRCGDELVSVAVSTFWACAVRARGDAYCWGKNDAAQLGVEPAASDPVGHLSGLGSFVYRDAPVAVSWPRRLRQVAASRDSACAIDDAGAVICWGGTDHDALGREASPRNCIGAAPGTNVMSCDPTPGIVGSLPAPAVEVVSGFHSFCARLESGEIYCWGNNDANVLGRDTGGKSSAVALRVEGLGGSARSLAGGHRHACAALTSGATVCWGDNGFGAAGQPASVAVAAPSLVGRDAANAPFGDVVEVAAGDAITCARRRSGEVWCWGYNGLGAIGMRNDGLAHPAPVKIPLPRPASRVVLGRSTAYAVDDRGAVWAWGFLGDGAGGVPFGSASECDKLLLCEPAARQIVGLSRIKTVAAGRGAAFAIDTAGRLFGWGATSLGALARPIKPTDVDRCRSSWGGAPIRCVTTPEPIALPR